MPREVSISSAAQKLKAIIRPYYSDVRAIYFYAFLHGFIELGIPLGIQSIVNFVMAQTFSTSITVLIIFVVVGVLLSGIFKINQMKIIEHIQQDLFVNYALRYTDHIPEIDTPQLQKEYLPATANKFLDIVILQKGISKLLLDIPIATIQITFGLLLLSFYSSIFLGFGGLLVLMLLLVLRFTTLRGLKTSMTESGFKYNVSNWLQEVSRLHKTFKLSKPYNLHLNKTDKNLIGYASARTAHFRILLSQYWSLIFFKVLITIAMLVVGVYLLINNVINIGQFVATEIVILAVMSSVEKFLLSLDSVYDSLTSAEKLNEVLSIPVAVSGTAIIDINMPSSCSLNNVSVSYDDNIILDNLSLDIQRGSINTIVGKSGSGKSMLLSLFSGIQTNFIGDVLINGLPIKNYNLNSYHKSVTSGINSFDVYTSSLHDNIAVGNVEVDTNKIISLAHTLEFEEVLSKYQLGLDTNISIDDKVLSKSDKRKITLLRVLCKSSTLILLEEPYQYLTATECSKLMAYFKSIQHKTTIIIISNNSKMALQTDQILLIENGKLKANAPSNNLCHNLKEFLDGTA